MITTTDVATESTTTSAETTTSESQTTAATTTTTGENAVYYGDVNQDGVVDLLDAIFLNKSLAGMVTLSDTASKCADCYDDNVLDDNDATILMRFVVSEIADLPSHEL